MGVARARVCGRCYGSSGPARGLTQLSIAGVRSAPHVPPKVKDATLAAFLKLLEKETNEKRAQLNLPIAEFKQSFDKVPVSHLREQSGQATGALKTVLSSRLQRKFYDLTTYEQVML